MKAVAFVEFDGEYIAAFNLKGKGPDDVMTKVERYVYANTIIGKTSSRDTREKTWSVYYNQSCPELGSLRYTRKTGFSGDVTTNPKQCSESRTALVTRI